jgi:hypothetical protein
MKIVLATALVTSITGCVEPSSTVLPTDNGKADGQQVTVTFADDFSETVDGPLVAGSRVRIRYDLDRATICRGFTNGSDAWGVSGFASFDGADPVVFSVSQIVDGTTTEVTPDLSIPHGASRVELWFENTDVFGCHAFDSNESANYAFDIERNDDLALLTFDGDFGETQSGDLRANGRVVLHYDPVRLEQCAASSGGMAKWSITAHYAVDGGPEKTTLVTRADGPDVVASDPTIAIGAGRELSLWFDATSVFGCHAVDTNFEAHYRFAID